MSRLVRIAAVVAPVLGLAVLWGISHQTYQQGTEWEVPIQGYDPRDYLRGHYVEFEYDWPGLADARFTSRGVQCIEGAPPQITRVTLPATPAEEAACGHIQRAPEGGVYGWQALQRGRLYIGQDRAAQLEQRLRNRGQRGIVTIRQREDGSFTPISIRFRPLTPAEITERDAQAAERAQPFASPVIVSTP